MRSYTLEYGKPAKEWLEALPIGNGRLGAMVFSDPGCDRLDLNEETLWSGFPKDTNNYNAYNSLEAVRQLVKEGKNRQAQDIIENSMLGPFTEAYEPLGSIQIDTDHNEYEAFTRILDIGNATASMEYVCGDVKYCREYIAAFSKNIIAVKLWSDKEKSITFGLNVTCPHPHTVKFSGDSMHISGKAPEEIIVKDVESFKGDNVICYDSTGKSLEFGFCIKVCTDGGKVKTAENGIKILAANSAVIYITAATSFNRKRPVQYCRRVVRDLSYGSYGSVKNNSIKIYKNVFDRVELSIEGDSTADAAGLLFQYGRYLLISSSLNCELPANLQGIWNDELIPPWWSNYTMNINTEMNYWPSEVCALEECNEPLFRFIQRLRENGRKTAKIHYRCKGWTSHHQSDIWARTSPVGYIDRKIEDSASWGMWNMAGAWLCRHLWEHFAFTLDKVFLKETAFPIMKESSEIILAWLVEDESGNLTTIPSTSPENIFLMPDDTRCAVDTGTAMDTGIITDLFSKCILAAEILKTENDLASRLRSSLERLMPIKINDGRLLEWSKPYTEEEIGHRHMSHLYALFPGDLITVDNDRKLSDAAFNSINHRLENGGGNTGWSRAWIIALWARLHNSQKVKESIDYFISDCVHPNMTGYQPPSFFQIDANFGFTAAIAEVFLQSYDGIYFLPALPSEWKKGHINGLKARGGYTIDISWQGGHISNATVRTSSAGVCQIKNTNIKRIIRDNKEIEWSRELKYARFKHRISESYEIHFLP